MGKSTRSVPKDRMSQKRLDALIQKPIYVDKERFEPHPVLSAHEEYDTLRPDVVVKTFCDSIREMLSKYESDKDELNTLENKMQDLLHFIEMSQNKNANAGYKLYKELCQVRRRRRAVKNEIDLLLPVYNMFHNTAITNNLAQLLGDLRSTKQCIDNRNYIVRTDILNEFVD